VLIDKPVGMNVAQAQGLADAIDSAGVVSQVILTNRYYDSMRTFLEEARMFDSYGGRASFFGNGCVPGSYFATPWRLQQGGLLDLGPHVLDGLDAALGTIVGITARGDAQKIVLLECEHENGRVSQAALSATSNQNGGLAVEVHGLDIFTVGADGGLTAQQRLTNVNAPFGGAKHPRQPFVAFAALADDASPGVISIRATGTAIPAIVSKLTAPSAVDPCWAATTPNGKKLWTSNFEPASLSLYSVKSNGRLAAVSTYTPSSDSPGALDIAVDPRGKFLYQLRALDPAGGANPTTQIDVLRIGGSSANGGLQLVQSIQLSSSASSGSPTGIAVSEP
jgi:hypothetical protein